MDGKRWIDVEASAVVISIVFKCAHTHASLKNMADDDYADYVTLFISLSSNYLNITGE
jgi:hypothetical protein